MKRIAMYTLSYNSEDWIYPFLKSTEGLEKRIVLQGRKPFATTDHLEAHPDRSEELIRECFPDVEIRYQIGRKWVDVFQEGLDYLADYDFVLRFDSDEIFLQKDWHDILELIQTTEMNSLKYNFGKAILYANRRDFDHGVIFDNDWIEVRGMNPKKQWPIEDYSTNPGLTITDKTMHHFSAWKGKGVAGWDTIPENKWHSCPEELRSLFEEGWRILESL